MAMSFDKPNEAAPIQRIPDPFEMERQRQTRRMIGIFGEAAEIIAQRIFWGRLQTVDLTSQETAFAEIYDVFHRHTNDPLRITPNDLLEIYKALVSGTDNTPMLGGGRKL